MAEKEKQPPDASLLSTDMLIVKSPSAEDPGGGGARCCLGCLRRADDRTALVSLGGMHVALGIVLVVGGALGAARGAALGAASAGLWGGGAAGAAGCAGLFAGLRGGGAAAFVALSLVALALSNLVAVLGATALVRDAARVDADAEAASSAVNGGLTAASLLHVAVCLWTVWRCYRLACPCLSQAHAQSRSSAASWDSAGSGRRKLVNSWLGTQRPPPLIVGPIFTIPAPPPNLPPASIINYHLPAPVPYINPLAQPRYIVSRPHSQVHSYTSRPKRKRAIEEVNRRHTLDGRRSSKTKKPPHQLTDEDMEKTYTGLDRNLAEEFIQIAMEPGLAKERESRSNSDNNSNHLR